MLQRILLGLGGTPFTEEWRFAGRWSCSSFIKHNPTAGTVINLKRQYQVGSVPLGAGSAAKEWCGHRIQAVGETPGSRHRESEMFRGRDVPCTIACEEENPFDLMIDYARYEALKIFGLRNMFPGRYVSRTMSATLMTNPPRY